MQSLPRTTSETETVEPLPAKPSRPPLTPPISLSLSRGVPLSVCIYVTLSVHLPPSPALSLSPLPPRCMSTSKVYFMGGRVAMTVQIPTSAYDVTVMASEAAPLINASSWQMGSIWVTKEEVLATPRLDGKK